MAGSGGFSITISAIDNASKQIDAVNKRIAGMQAPAERVTKSLAKFADVSGIKSLAGGFRDVARESFQAFENIGRMAGPMGAISGAASIAGVVKLSGAWSSWGANLRVSAQRAGTTATQMARLQGAAVLAGSSADAMTSGLTTLNDNLNNAAAGRAPQAMLAFNQLGISLRDANGHVRSGAEVLPELADKLDKIQNPTIRAQLAQMALGGAADDLWRLLSRGSAGIEQYSDRAGKLAGITNDSADAAEHARENNAALGLAFQGLGNAIGERFTPDITSATTAITHWIESVGKSVHAGGDATTSVTVWTRAMEAFGIAVTTGAFGPLRRLEMMLLRIGLIKPAAWMLRLLGAVAGTAAGSVAVAGGAFAAAGAVGAVAADKSSQANLTTAQRAAALGYTVASTTDENGLATEWKNPATGKRITAYELDSGKAIASPSAPAAATPTDNALTTHRLHGSMQDPRGIRNNNPGNINFAGQAGATLEDHEGARFAQFGTMQQGIDAMTNQLQLYQKRGINTVAGMISKWAPPSDNNNTAAYIDSVSKALGTKPDAPIDINDPKTRDTMERAIISVENGPKYADAVLPSGGPAAQIGGGTGGSAAAQSVTVKGSADLNVRVSAPPGTTTTASTSGSLFQGAPKVMQAMPATDST